MMARRIAFMIVAGVLLIVSPSIAAERYNLRAPGGALSAMVNEVAVWKTAEAAKKAGRSLDSNFMFDKSLACVVRPGTKADVLKREGAVVYVRASNALFGGCRGYIKTQFLSKD